MMDPNTHDDWAQQRWRKEDYEEQLSVFLASMHVIPNTIVFFFYLLIEKRQFYIQVYNLHPLFRGQPDPMLGNYI